MSLILVADSGSTTTQWGLIHNNKHRKFTTQGISPFFLNEDQIAEIFKNDVLPKLKNQKPVKIFFYGTGCSNEENVKKIKNAFQKLFKGAIIKIETDLLGAARALCGQQKGIACILGTGSNSGFYNGTKIMKNNPGLGYILGDEGSGSYLGKKVIQYFLYNTFDADLYDRFQQKYQIDKQNILDKVYRGELPNRFIAGFTDFLVENRGHYMVENIIEDGLNDFFTNHIYKYKESWSLPIHFVGSVAFGFRDVLKQIMESSELKLGNIQKSPIAGLITYHRI